MKTIIIIISTLFLISCTTALNTNQNTLGTDLDKQSSVNKSEENNKFKNLQLLKAKESQLYKDVLKKFSDANLVNVISKKQEKE